VRFAGSSANVLEATREVIREARSIVDSGDPPRLSLGRSGIIGAYEALCSMLDGVDPDQLKSLIGRVARHLEELNHLADDVERVRQVRQGMRET